jgi:hypothetical protein
LEQLFEDALTVAAVGHHHDSFIPARQAQRKVLPPIVMPLLKEGLPVGAYEKPPTQSIRQPDPLILGRRRCIQRRELLF